jgi:hypothetical protein
VLVTVVKRWCSRRWKCLRVFEAGLRGLSEILRYAQDDNFGHCMDDNFGLCMDDNFGLCMDDNFGLCVDDNFGLCRDDVAVLDY